MIQIEDEIILLIIAANTLLAGLLLAIYVRNWKSIKSKLTIGLIFFSFAFLVENLIDLYFYNLILSQEYYGLSTFGFTVNAFEFVGLIILLYITWE